METPDSSKHQIRVEQQLSILSSFVSQLEYLQNEFSRIDWKSGFDLAEFFYLLKPESDKEQRQLRQLQLDWYRSYLAHIQMPVKKADGRWELSRQSDKAYKVILLDDLKNDFNHRLSAPSCQNKILQVELTKNELNQVSAKIDAARNVEVNALTGKIEATTLTQYIDRLREFLQANSSIDLLEIEEDDVIQSIYQLALIWDIVYYERYLHVQLVNLQSSETPIWKVVDLNKKLELDDKHHMNYNSFSELFQQGSDVESCVEILRSVEIYPPLIDKERNWTGKKGSKAYLVAWIDRLQSTKIIIELCRKKEIIPLLNEFFPGLKMGIGGSSLSEQKGNYRKALDFFSLKIHKKIAK